MKRNVRVLIGVVYCALASAALMLSGCADEGVNAPVPNIALVVRTPQVSPASGGGEGLQLSEVKILLKRIRFHSAVSDDSSDVSAGGQVVVLNLQGGETPVVASRIPGGRYDRLRFRLHKPEDSEPVPDPEFRTGTRGDERFSVIVRGSINGTPFLYRSSENAEQEHTFSPPVVVPDEGTVVVRLLLEPARWFMDQERVLDPSNPDDARRIDERIRQGFARIGT